MLVALVGVVWLTIDAVVDQWSEISLLISEGRETLSTAMQDGGVAVETARSLDEDVGDSVGRIVDLLFRGAVELVPATASLVTSVLPSPRAS
jgi:hypothetical protein